MRTFPAPVLAAYAAGTFVERWIVRATLPGGVFGASDDPDWVTWDNGAGPVAYAPLDEGLRITIPAVQSQLRQDPATIVFGATDPNLISDLLLEPYRGAPTDICKLVFVNGVPAYEVLKFRGWMDQATVEDAAIRVPTSEAGGGAKQDEITASIVSLTVAPKTVDMKRANPRWATDVDQRAFRDGSDSFFQDVALVGVSQINFGQAGSSSPANTAASSAEGAPSGVASIVGRISVNPTNGFV